MEKRRKVQGGVMIGEGHKEVFVSDLLIQDMDRWLAVGTRRQKAADVRAWLTKAYKLA